ncbi:methyl-accepting chemotaxis protein [Rhodopseudomonas sp.]|uniref:methyl-accepting chemotaxis protein n=1 Tax=Rhodopseudomonas sp. TaxID=1078 RepID=UPI0039E5C481
MAFAFRSSLANSRNLAALGTSEVPIIIADSEFVIRFANDAVRELLRVAETDFRNEFPDFSVDSLVGRSINCFHKNPKRQRDMLGTLNSKHRATVRVGNWTFDLAANPLFDVKGHRIGTAVEWADASLRLANIQFKAVADALSRSQAMIEFEPDGTVITANDNFLNALGYSLDEIKNRHHRIFVEPNFAKSAEYGRFWDKLRVGEYISSEFKRIGKNGREVWIQASYNPVFDEKGRVFKIVKIATDVTKTKLENANLLGQIGAIHKSQAVIEFGLDGTILNANDNFLRLTGYRLEDIRGKPHRMLVAPEERESPAYREFWNALGRGEYRADRFRRIGKDGSEFYIQASYNPIVDLNGTPWKIVKFAHDITAEHVAKLAAEREREELISAVASGAEQLNSSVREIAETMVKSRETAVQAGACVDQADEISQRFNETAQATAGIVDMIRGITDQINLLALNATIESARAGEAGRGFSVVATEVKNLANQAKVATEKITREIEAMQTSSTEVVSALVAVKREIEVVQQYVSSTAAAVEEQSVVANELSATVQRAVSD